MVVSAAAAQQSQTQTWCYGDDSTDDQTIAGCTKLIQSGRENQRDLASAYFNRGLAYKAKSDLAMAYTIRGVAYGLKGDFDRAIADYTQAIQLDPKNAVSYNNRGAAYGIKGDLDGAIADYARAIQLDPKDATAYNNRCIVYTGKGDLDRAIADCTQAIRLDPTAACPTTTAATRIKTKVILTAQQSRLRLQSHGRPRSVHSRLHAGDPAQSETCEGLQQPLLGLLQQRQH